MSCHERLCVESEARLRLASCTRARRAPGRSRSRCCRCCVEMLRLATEDDGRVTVGRQWDRSITLSRLLADAAGPPRALHRAQYMGFPFLQMLNNPVIIIRHATWV